MVIGEPQILGQMKDAVRPPRKARLARLAQDVPARLYGGQGSPYDHRHWRQHRVDGGSRRASGGAHFERISDQRVLFIGAGEMIELCATISRQATGRKLVIANRTMERGRRLLSASGARRSDLTKSAIALAQFDIVVSCTASRCRSSAWAWSNARSRRAATGRCSWSTWRCRATSSRKSANSTMSSSTPSTISAQVVEPASSRGRRRGRGRGDHHHAGRGLPAGWKTRDTVPLDPLAARFRRAHASPRDGACAEAVAKGEPPEKVLEQFSQRLTNKFLHAPTQA